MIAADLYGFHQPPMIWLASVGDSGRGKTGAINNFATHPLSLVKKEYAIINQRRWTEHEAACMLADKGPKPPKPTLVFASVENFTFAALKIALEAHQEENIGMLIKVQELAGLFQGLNQFSQGGKGDEQQQMLCLWDGSGEPTLRVKEGARLATRWHVSVIGGIQQDVFDTYIKNGDPDGLFARLLLLPLAKRDMSAVFVDQTLEQAQALHQASEKVASFTAALHRLPPATYTFSKAAREEKHRLLRQTDDMIDREVIKANRNVYGKRVGYVVRIAGILHLCEVAAGRMSVTDHIPLGTVVKATALVDFLQAYACEAHVRAQQADEVTIDDLMRRIHIACLDKPMGAGRFRADYLSPKQRKAYSSEAIAAYMEQLVALDCGTWLELAPRARARNFQSRGRLS